MFIRRNTNKEKGFTLIEVLVVVAIIGILTAILVANYNDARKNSRDKIRKSELKELQLAIELYKAQYGRYPAPGCGASTALWVGPGPLSSWGYGNCNDYISGLVPNFIAALPTDPNQENDQDLGYKYRTDTNGTIYKVIIHNSVESIVVTSQADEMSRMPEVCGISSGNLFPRQYSIYSAGAECL